MRGDNAKDCLMEFREIRATQEAYHDSRARAPRQEKKDDIFVPIGVDKM